MIQIFASCNSRYFVLRRDNELSLYRVPARLWSKTVPGLQEIVGVGNRGDVYFRTITNGLCRLNVNPKGDLEKVSWENVLLAANDGHGRVEKVIINGDGTEMFAELNMPSQSLSTSWRSFFGPGEKSPGTCYDHVLYRIGDSTSKLYSLPRVTTISAHGEFCWAVSREFTYCVTAVLQKRGLYEFLVYRVKRKEVIASFTLPDCIIHEMSIDDFGRVSVEIEVDGQAGKRMLIVRDTCNNCYNLPLEEGATVLNVWKDRACWKTPNELAIQRLDGDMMCRVSTEPLNCFGVDYYFLFNHNNDINLAMGLEEELIITPVNPDNLAHDAQRWTRVSELKRGNEIAAEEQARQEIEVQEAKKERYQQLRNRLDSTLDSIKSKRQKERQEMEEMQASVESSTESIAAVVEEEENPVNVYQDPVNRASVTADINVPNTLARNQAIVINDIKILRERYATGAVTRDEYLHELDKLNEELLSLHC